MRVRGTRSLIKGSSGVTFSQAVIQTLKGHHEGGKNKPLLLLRLYRDYYFAILLPYGSGIKSLRAVAQIDFARNIQSEYKHGKTIYGV